MVWFAYELGVIHVRAKQFEQHVPGRIEQKFGRHMIGPQGPCQDGGFDRLQEGVIGVPFLAAGSFARGA